VKRIAAVLLLGATLVGCAGNEQSKYVRDGVEYGVTEGVFRGRWWSYYERGTSFLAGRFYEEAASDFQTALQGRDRDSWRARTYGLHFVEYFPNRELGITLYHLGQLDEAERYLKASLAQLDTERAHHYLDEIKRARIASGAQPDTSAPAISISAAPADVEVDAPEIPALLPQASLRVMLAMVGPAAGMMPDMRLAQAAPQPAAGVVPPAEPQAVVSSAPGNNQLVLAENEFKLQVNASDDNGVSEIAIKDDPQYVRESAPQKQVAAKLDLEEGTHAVPVAATDLAGKAVTEDVQVTVDTSAPSIGVLSPIEPTVTDRGTVILKGATRDKVGVTVVNVDDRVLAESPGQPVLPFNAELPLGDGENTFLLAARDTVGNEARTAIKVFKGDPDSAQAKLWLIREKFPEKLHMAMADPGRFSPEYLDMVIARAEAEAKSLIRLKSPSVARPWRNSRSVQVSGDIVTQSEVTGITINGQPVDIAGGSAKESFNRRVRITPEERAAGSKTIVIEATDAAGHRLREAFTVELETVGLAAAESRIPVAVLGFQAMGVADTVPATVQHELAQSLAARNRFHVLGEGQVREAAQGRNLNNPDEALAIGQALPVQYILSGTAFAHEAGMELKTRVINMETAEVVETLDTYVPDVSQPGAVARACRNLAVLMEQRFPRVSGVVTGVKGSQITLDLTERDVRPGGYVVLVVKEPDQVDPDSGEIIWPGAERVLCKARVESAGANGSQAVIVEMQQEGVPVEEGMPAVTM
jgi:TolB-like protein